MPLISSTTSTSTSLLRYSVFNIAALFRAGFSLANESTREVRKPTSRGNKPPICLCECGGGDGNILVEAADRSALPRILDLDSIL